MTIILETSILCESYSYRGTSLSEFTRSRLGEIWHKKELSSSISLVCVMYCSWTSLLADYSQSFTPLRRTVVISIEGMAFDDLDVEIRHL